MRLRHLFTWKAAFYRGLLPALRRLDPRWSDAALGALGRAVAAAWPPRRAVLSRGAAKARGLPGEDVRLSAADLGAGVIRFLARDYLLDLDDDAEALARFDVEGFEHVRAALARRRGVVLLGSHFGAHLSALHWLYRRGVPLRLLVQRPRHVSTYLNDQFDRDDGAHPQVGFFLRREMPPAGAAERLLRARAALRDGTAVYLTGDIPWPGPNTRPGRLLGRRLEFLSVWADLAALTRAPVVPLFCGHRPGGRLSLRFDAPWTVAPGGEAEAVTRYLARVESEVAAHPADAVPYLTWPCYSAEPGPTHAPSSRRTRRPRRDVAAPRA